MVSSGLIFKLRSGCNITFQGFLIFENIHIYYILFSLSWYENISPVVKFGNIFFFKYSHVAYHNYEYWHAEISNHITKEIEYCIGKRKPLLFLYIYYFYYDSIYEFSVPIRVFQYVTRLYMKKISLTLMQAIPNF